MWFHFQVHQFFYFCFWWYFVVQELNVSKTSKHMQFKITIHQTLIDLIWWYTSISQYSSVIKTIRANITQYVPTFWTFFPWSLRMVSPLPMRSMNSEETANAVGASGSITKPSGIASDLVNTHSSSTRDTQAHHHHHYRTLNSKQVHSWWSMQNLKKKE